MMHFNNKLWGVLFFSFLMINQYIYAHNRDSLHVTHLEFVENRNQWHSNVLFKAKFANGALFAEKNCITYILLNSSQLESFVAAKNNPALSFSGNIDAAAYKMNFIGANEAVKVFGKDELPYYHNYYIGNDKNKWASNVPVFHDIYYENIYPGIDLTFFQDHDYLKYEFIVKKSAAPEAISLHYDGVKSITLNHDNLIITTGVGDVVELKPRAYQIDKNGDTIVVDCQYQVTKQLVSFKLGIYDKDLALVIDPTIIFSSYSGSTADNWGYTATYDDLGNLYGGGIVFGLGYPLTTGVYQTTYAGGDCDIGISKFDATGSFLHYSTYLGGSGVDIPNSLYVNDNDELYVLGTTGSSDFPITTGAFDSTFGGGTTYILSSVLNFTNGSDIVVVKFNQNGQNLIGSTYIGGTNNDGLNTSSGLKKNYGDEARGEIIIDINSNVYVASSTLSTDFPATNGVFQPQHNGGLQDACIIKINQNLTNMIWASYLGGSGNEGGYSIVLSSDNTIYVCGGTNSADFPTTSDVIQQTYAGGTSGSAPDGFVTHINENGTQILKSTFLGESGYDQAYLIKNDKFDCPHIFGQTAAPDSFWIKNAGWYVVGGGQFLTKLTPELDSIIWSTAFGTGNGGPDISPTALLVDLCSNIYMSGWGSILVNQFGGTSGLPITANAFQSTTDNNDYYFICISDDASALVYATYFGSPNSREHVDGGTSRFDNKGRIYQAVCAGCGGYDNFPTTPGAWSQVNGSTNCNLGVIKLDFNLPVVIADFDIPNVVCAPIDLSFNNDSQTISDSTTFFWSFGDGNTSTLRDPTHFYTNSGVYMVQLIVQDAGSCNFSDTLTRQLVVLSNSTDTLETKYICVGNYIQIGIPPSGDENLTYSWYPSTDLSNPTISNPIASPDSTIMYVLYISNGVCFDTLYQLVSTFYIDIEIGNDTTICRGESVLLSPTVSGSPENRYFWSIQPDFSTIINSDPLQYAITVNPLFTTTYYLKVTGGGCVALSSITVNVSFIELTEPPPYTICFEDSIQISIGTDCSNCHYQWSPTESILGETDSRTIWINPYENTTYTVTVTNEFGCTAVGNITVIKRTNTFPEEVVAWCDKNRIIYGDSTYLHATTFGSPGYNYQWIPTTGVVSPNSPNTLVYPVVTTIYTCIVTDQYGCPKSDTVLIIVDATLCDEPYIFVPNAFSPNGDSKNDILYVRGDYIEKFTFRIYDRWGEKIFETQDLNEGWDGTYKGKISPPGIYDYYLEVHCVDQQYYLKKGNITLLR